MQHLYCSDKDFAYRHTCPHFNCNSDANLYTCAYQYACFYCAQSDGFYTVGLEIVPAKWHSTGTGDGCYWERPNESQGVLGNHYGIAGGTVNVQASDYEVHFDDCGTWEYVGP